MKSLSIIAALTLGLAAQAAAAEPAAKISPGMAPKAAHQYVPAYDIVTAKVAEGVRLANAAPAGSFRPEANPAGWAVFKALPRRD